MHCCLVRGCWSANIGNAFLDLGAEAITKNSKLFDKIFSQGSHSRWIFDHWVNSGFRRKRYSKNYLNHLINIKADIFIFTGMVLTRGFFRRYGNTIRELCSQGKEIFFLGAGGYEYSEEEYKEVCQWIEKLQVKGLIARDKFAFEKYKNFCKSGLGTDCGFYISKSYKPEKRYINEFYVLNNDRLEDNIPKKDVEMITKNSDIVRTHHSTMTDQIKRYHVSEPNTFISDQYSDYIDLIFNSKGVITGRVHSAVCAASYGIDFFLKTGSRRKELFYPFIEFVEEDNNWIKCKNNLNKKIDILYKKQTNLFKEMIN